MAHFIRVGAWRRVSLLLTAVVALAFAPAAASAQAADPLDTPVQHITILDFQTNRILYCRDCHEPIPPASMAKLMTLVVVAEKLKAGAIKWNTMLPVSENAWRHGAVSDGSHMFLPIHSQVSVADLVHGVSIVSANDACIVLAEGISGSEEGFVALMNEEAQKLGLKTARFRNATGLDDPDQRISSADLARLARYIMANFPDIYRLDSQITFTFNGKTQQNRNPLLPGEHTYAGAFSFAGADGVKTGHTDESLYGLVGSAQVNGKRRIIVFNGARSMKERASEANRLMRAAFFDFDAKRLFEKGQKVGEADVWMGARKTVPLVATAPVDIGFHRAVKSQIHVKIVYDKPVPAPIKKGDVIGDLVITGPAGVESQKIPLAAGEKIGRANIFSRALFGAKTLFGGT
jgi:D-alanyl-D-alanine carboxypeptidase (penicillin-binding protein 5/6)